MRPVPRPGSVLWLLAHDACLAWRDFRATFRAVGDRALAVLFCVLLLVVHVVAWRFARQLITLQAQPGGSAAAEVAAVPVVLFVMLLMVAQTLNGVTKLMYSRGDLDLLLSSPVSVSKVLLVRGLAVALGALTSSAIFVLPLANAGLASGHLRFLAIYPALVGAALLAAALGLLIGFGLFAMIGPRLTRVAAQILATFIGAAFMIGLQLHTFLPSFSLDALVSDAHAAPYGLSAVLLLPARAALGEPQALAAWLIATTGCFVGVAALLGRSFAHHASAASSLAPRPPGRARPHARSGGAKQTRSPETFRRGVLPSLRLKEWRLIARDPWGISQILLQILYMTPMVALLWTGNRSPDLALAPMIVVVCFQVASSLTWLSLSGEDAPDLLLSAPVSTGTIRRGKLEAVGMLTLAVIAAPLAWLALISPGAAALTLLLGGFGLANAVLLQLSQGRPAKRSAFAARHRESKMLALIEMALSMLWGVTTALVILHSAWALVPFAVLAGLVLCTRPRRYARA